MLQEPQADSDERNFQKEDTLQAPDGASGGSDRIEPKVQKLLDIQKPNVHFITILVCAGLSLLFMNTGLLSFFYLAPLGYAIIVSGSFLNTFIIAAAAGIAFNIIKYFSSSNSGGSLMLEIMYFSVIVLGFTWIIGGRRFRTAYRFMLASIAGAVVSLIFINSPHVKFYDYLHEIFTSIFGSSNELMMEDERTRGLLNMQSFSPEQMTEMARSFILRGGALISMFFLLFINRQIAAFAVSIVKRQRRDLGLIKFSAPVNTIWVLSGAIATIILTNMFKFEVVGILAWNVFTACAAIFLAQGAGVLMFWLSLRTNVFRLVINVLIVVILFSPLNIFAVAALLILGVADIWVSFRTPKVI